MRENGTAAQKNARPSMRSIVDRLPPQSLEAEQGVLGSILLDASMLDEIVAILKAEDFYRDIHQHIYQAILDLYGEGKRIDALTVIGRLDEKGQFAEIGNETLSEILESVPHAANAKFYADIVREKATMRAAIETANTILQDVYSNDCNSKQVLQRAEKSLFKIATRQVSGNLRSLGDIIPGVLDSIDQRVNRKPGSDAGGLSSGFTDLDFITGLFHPGQLVVIGARPSHGKSALAWAIADHAAVEKKKPALFASLEMSGESLAERALSMRSEVDGHKLRTGYGLETKDFEGLGKAYAELKNAPIWIDDSSSQSMLEALSTARRVKMRHGLSLYVFDYAQLAEPDGTGETRQEQVAAISRRLKAMARELEVPVVALSQLNRQVDYRTDHQPVLADLRESGSIEQDADIVILMYRPERYDPVDQPGIAIADVAKNRNGSTGVARLKFRKELTRFENLAKADRIAEADGNFGTPPAF